MDCFRIHGDNIVECERLLDLILGEIEPDSFDYYLVSPSTKAVDVSFLYCHERFEWHIELLPGFNKANRHRWEGSIFQSLRMNGSFLDETPDVIVSRVCGNQEQILFAVEFCSALQAGNQAWQRSGRAFSTGRTGCPYLYIVDFVRYELTSATRKRKALRMPNAAVPYSYYNFSVKTGCFVAQVFTRAEEFDKTREVKLRGFDDDFFGEKELSSYIIKTMAQLDTEYEENQILRKNLLISLYLADISQSGKCFTPEEWIELSENRFDTIQYCIDNSRFPFRKKISEKGSNGKALQVRNLIADCSVGFTAKELPIGIIPAENRPFFANTLSAIYPSFDTAIIERIANNADDMIVCMIKGFKPGGDDNRPDRGALPLAYMLSARNVEVFTFLYGPIFYSNFELLLNYPGRLRVNNGLWNSIISMSDYLALDVPILRGDIRDAEVLLDTSIFKNRYLNTGEKRVLVSDVFSSSPTEYHEDDVDTGIHYLFANVLSRNCFEGMCNPPGGDWSGLSVISGDYEVRWLSLPRVSGDAAGKRPDHVIEIFNVFDRPILLSIESKENSADLEPDVGVLLLNYLDFLMRFVPSVEQKINPTPQAWRRAEHIENIDDFVLISAAAYLSDTAQSDARVSDYSQCDMLFVMSPINSGWDIRIVANTADARILKEFIVRELNETGNQDILVH